MYQKLHKAKTVLEEAYKNIEEEELNTMVKQVEEADISCRHSVSWKLINSITGRKNVKRSVLKGTSKEDRLKKMATTL